MSSISNPLTRDLIDQTYGLITDQLKDYINAGPRDNQFPADCLHEAGYDRGSYAAAVDIVHDTVGGPRDIQADNAAFKQAYEACGVDKYVEQAIDAQTNDLLLLPSTLSPVVAALEIALTPTPLNVGEKEGLEAARSESIFHEGVEDGYRATASIDPNDAHDAWNYSNDHPHDPPEANGRDFENGSCHLPFAVPVPAEPEKFGGTSDIVCEVGSSSGSGSGSGSDYIGNSSSSSNDSGSSSGTSNDSQ